jgi:hypothetical protein
MTLINRFKLETCMEMGFPVLLKNGLKAYLDFKANDDGSICGKVVGKWKDEGAEAEQVGDGVWNSDGSSCLSEEHNIVRPYYIVQEISDAFNSTRQNKMILHFSRFFREFLPFIDGEFTIDYQNDAKVLDFVVQKIHEEIKSGYTSVKSLTLNINNVDEKELNAKNDSLKMKLLDLIEFSNKQSSLEINLNFNKSKQELD